MTAETRVKNDSTIDWKFYISLALFVLGVAYFAKQVVDVWPKIKDYDWALDWRLMGLSLVLLLICSLADIFIWNRTLGWFTDPLPFNRAAPVYIWSFLARYIPGKVGSLVLRVTLGLEAGRPAEPVLACSLVELALRISAAAVIAIIAVLSWGATSSPHALLYTVFTVLVILVVLICTHPRVMLPIINWTLVKVKRQPILRPVRYSDVLRVFGMLLVRWVIYGISYALLAIAIYHEAVTHIPALIGVASGAWAAGFIVMVPGGLGASEAAQTTVLTSMTFPLAMATMIPVLARLITLVGEGLWSLAVIPLRASWHSGQLNAGSEGTREGS